MNFLKNILKKYKVLILLLLLFIIFLVINNDKIEGFINKPQVNLKKAILTLNPGDIIILGEEYIVTTSGGDQIPYTITEEDFDLIENQPLAQNIRYIKNDFYLNSSGLDEYNALINRQADLGDILTEISNFDQSGDAVQMTGVFLSEDIIIIDSNQGQQSIEIITTFDQNYSVENIMKWYVDTNFDNVIRLLPSDSHLKDISGYGYKIVDGVAVECEPGTYMPKNKREIINRAENDIPLDNDWSECIPNEKLSNEVHLAFDSTFGADDSKQAFTILDIIAFTLNLVPQKNKSIEYYDINSSLIQDNELIHSNLEEDIPDMYEDNKNYESKFYKELKIKIVEDNTSLIIPSNIKQRTRQVKMPCPPGTGNCIPPFWTDAIPTDGTPWQRDGLTVNIMEEYLEDPFDDWIVNNLTYTKGFLNRIITNGYNYTSDGCNYISLPDSFKETYRDVFEDSLTWTADQPLIYSGIELLHQDKINRPKKMKNTNLSKRRTRIGDKTIPIYDITKSTTEYEHDLSYSDALPATYNGRNATHYYTCGFEDNCYEWVLPSDHTTRSGTTYFNLFNREYKCNYDGSITSRTSTDSTAEIEGNCTYGEWVEEPKFVDLRVPPVAYTNLHETIGILTKNNTPNIRRQYPELSETPGLDKRYRADINLERPERSIELLKNVYRNKRHPRYEGSEYEGLDDESTSDGSDTTLPSTIHANPKKKDHSKNSIVLLGNISGLPDSDTQDSDDSIFEGNAYIIDKFTSLMYLKGDKNGRPSERDSEKIKTVNVSDYENINGTDINVKTYNYLITAIYSFSRPPVTIGSKYQNLTDLTFGGWGTPPFKQNNDITESDNHSERGLFYTNSGVISYAPFNTNNIWKKKNSRSNIELFIPSDILGWHMDEYVESSYENPEYTDTLTEHFISNMIGLKNSEIVGVEPGSSLSQPINDGLDTTEREQRERSIDNELWDNPSIGVSVRGAAPFRHYKNFEKTVAGAVDTTISLDNSKPLYHLDNLKNMRDELHIGREDIRKKKRGLLSVDTKRSDLPGNPDGVVTEDYRKQQWNEGSIDDEKMKRHSDWNNVPEYKPNYYLIGNDIGVISTYYELGTHITFRENPKNEILFKNPNIGDPVDDPSNSRNILIKDDGSSYKLITNTGSTFQYRTNNNIADLLPTRDNVILGLSLDPSPAGDAPPRIWNPEENGEIKGIYTAEKWNSSVSSGELFTNLVIKRRLQAKQSSIEGMPDVEVNEADVSLLDGLRNREKRLEVSSDPGYFETDGLFYTLYEQEGSTSWSPTFDGFNLDKTFMFNYFNIIKNGVFSSSFASASTFQYRSYLDYYHNEGKHPSSAGSPLFDQMYNNLPERRNIGYPEVFPNKWQGGSNIPIITKEKREWYKAPEFLPLVPLDGDDTDIDTEPLFEGDYIGRDVNPFFYCLPSHVKREKIEDLNFNTNIIRTIFETSTGDDNTKYLFFNQELNEQISALSDWDEPDNRSWLGNRVNTTSGDHGLNPMEWVLGDAKPIPELIKNSEIATKIRQTIGSNQIPLERKHKIMIGSCRNVFNASFHSPFGITNPRPITNDYLRTIKIEENRGSDTFYNDVSFTLSEIPILRNYKQEGPGINPDSGDSSTESITLPPHSIPSRITELTVESGNYVWDPSNPDQNFSEGAPWKEKYINFRESAINSTEKILDDKVSYGSITSDEKGTLLEEIRRSLPDFPSDSESSELWRSRFKHNLSKDTGSTDPNTKHKIILSVWDRFTEYLQINTYPNISYNSESEANASLDIEKEYKDDISSEGKMFHLSSSGFGKGEKEDKLKTTKSMSNIREPVSIGDTLPRIARLPTEKTFGFGRADTTIFNSNYNDNHRCLLDSIDQINYSPTWSTGRTAYLILSNFLYNYIYINERNVPVFDERSIQPISLKTPIDFNPDDSDYNNIVNDITNWGGDDSEWDKRKLVDNDIFRFSHQPSEYWNSQTDKQLRAHNINEYFYATDTYIGSENKISSEIFRIPKTLDGGMFIEPTSYGITEAGFQASIDNDNIDMRNTFTKNKGIYEVINFFKSLNQLYTGSPPVGGTANLPLDQGGLGSDKESVENFIYEKYLEKIFRKIFLYLNQSTKEETPIPTPGLNFDINNKNINDGLYTTPFKPRDDEKFRKNDEDYPLHSIISKTLTLQNKHISKFAEDSWKEIINEGFTENEYPETIDDLLGSSRPPTEEEIIEHYGFIMKPDGDIPVPSNDLINIGYGINNKDSWADLNGLGRPRNIWRKVLDSTTDENGVPFNQFYTQSDGKPSGVQVPETGQPGDTVFTGKYDLLENGEIIKVNLNRTTLITKDIYDNWEISEPGGVSQYKAVITSQGIGGEAWLPEKDRFYNYIDISEGERLPKEGTDEVDDFTIVGDSAADPFIGGKISRHLNNVDRINFYKLYNTIASEPERPYIGSTDGLIGSFLIRRGDITNRDKNDVWLQYPIISNIMKEAIRLNPDIDFESEVLRQMPGGNTSADRGGRTGDDFLLRLEKSVLHNAKYNPYISELVGITNTYNGRPAFHDFVLKAGFNSWCGMVDGVGGIDPHFVDIHRLPNQDFYSSFDSTGGQYNDISLLNPENPFADSNDIFNRPIPVSKDNHNHGVELRKSSVNDGYLEKCQTMSSALGPRDDDLPFKHIFRTEPFKVNDVIYHRLVLPMPPQIMDDSEDPYGIGIKGPDQIPSPLDNDVNQRHYYNVMFWKNIYDIISPKNSNYKSRWFDSTCHFQPGCAEHDMEATCIQIDRDGRRVEGGSSNQVDNRFYYQCVRPYLWDPKNNIMDAQYDGF